MLMFSSVMYAQQSRFRFGKFNRTLELFNSMKLSLRNTEMMDLGKSHRTLWMKEVVFLRQGFSHFPTIPFEFS